jgi:hypothetical protein
MDNILIFRDLRIKLSTIQCQLIILHLDVFYRDGM